MYYMKVLKYNVSILKLHKIFIIIIGKDIPRYMTKHLTIRDADTNEEFETEEIEPSDNKDKPAEDIPDVDVPADESADKACCFSDDEMAALKSLIEMLPDLKALLDVEAKEHADKPED